MDSLTAPEGLLERILDDRTYPDTEAYTLHWLGGSSGAFIGSLMTYYIWPDRDYFLLNRYGNSHDGLDGDDLNWLQDSYRGGGIPGGHVEWMPVRHRYLRPRDPSQPILMHDHIPPDWSTLWQRWPRARAVVVSFRSSDTVEMSFNMYWKFFTQYYRPQEGGNSWFLDMKQRRPEIFLKYDHPADISVEDLKQYLGGGTTQTLPDTMLGSAWGVQGDEPRDRQHLVLRIPYWRLTRQPEWVLQRLSEFLERPITDQAREFCDRYIANQNRMIAEKAPWLREPGNYANQPMTDED
jgi:hypothetical protein